MHTSRAQNIIKGKWIIDNLELISKVFLKDVPHPHRTHDGKVLILKARNELGYSKRTASCDIFCSMSKTWNEIIAQHKNKNAMPYGKAIYDHPVKSAMMGHDKPGSLYFIVREYKGPFVGIYQQLDNVLFMGTMQQCLAIKEHEDYTMVNILGSFCFKLLGDITFSPSYKIYRKCLGLFN